MKPNDLLKIIDSGDIKILRLYYCGGHIDVATTTAPFELPDYEISRIGTLPDGNGLFALLADNRTKAERTAEIKAANDETPKITDNDAKTALYVLNEYCGNHNDGCRGCIFNYGIGEKCGISGIPDIIDNFETKGGKE